MLIKISEIGSSGGRGHKKPPLQANLPEGGVSKPIPKIESNSNRNPAPKSRDIAAKAVGVRVSPAVHKLP